MKKIQKKLSVVLAVMMVLCMFTALPFSASAAETSEETSAGNKINVTSNVADPVSYDYNAQTKQVVVTYLLKADHMIVNAQSSLTYDSKVLKLASTNTREKVFPVFQSSIVWNPSLTNQVLFNCSSLDLFNFKSENVYCTFTFDVTLILLPALVSSLVSAALAEKGRAVNMHSTIITARTTESCF